MTTLSAVPKITQLVTVTPRYSGSRAWVFRMSTQPVWTVFFSLPILTFWSYLGKASDLAKLRSHWFLGRAQKMLGILFFLHSLITSFVHRSLTPPPLFTAVTHLPWVLSPLSSWFCEDGVHVTLTLVLPADSTVPGTQWAYWLYSSPLQSLVTERIWEINSLYEHKLNVTYLLIFCFNNG